jgi:hypothetical protein
LGSIREESSNSITNIGEHFIELFLGVELVVLTESSSVVSDVLEDLIIEASPHWRDDVNTGGDSCDDE